MTGLAEAHDHSISGAFRFRAPREQGIARRQKLEIIEANAAQARRAGSLHHQQIASAAVRAAIAVLGGLLVVWLKADLTWNFIAVALGMVAFGLLALPPLISRSGYK